MSVRSIRACLLSRSKTAPSIPTSLLAAMAATQVAMQVAAAEVYPAVAVTADSPAVVEVAPEEMVGVEVKLTVEAEEVAPSSMVETVLTRGAVAHTSAVAQAAPTITAMVPLALAAAAVEEEGPVAESWTLPMEAMEPMAPTVAVGVAVASVSNSRTRTAAAVVVMADLAGAVAAQERAGLSSVAVMEETADLAAAQASA